MRKFLSNVMYIFFGLPLALSALMMISVRPWALDRETYKRFVLDDRLYAALRSPEAAKEAPATIRIQGREFAGPALVAAIQKNLPVEAIKSTGSGAIDTTMDAALGGSGLSTAAIDLKKLKTALKDASPAVARDYVAALPAKDEAPSQTDFTYRPTAVSVKAETTVMAKALATAVDGIPDAPALDVSPPASATRFGVIAQGASGISQALLNRWTAVTAAFSALLLVGLGALGGSTWGARLSRAGKYMLIPSVFVLAIGAVLAIPGGLLIQNLMPREVQAMLHGETASQVRAYLAGALAPIWQGFFITGLVGASLGGLLVSSRRIVEPKEIE
jgi:hypothetical protein